MLNQMSSPEALKEDLPCNVSSIEDTQPDRILMVSEVSVGLQSQNLCVSNIGAIDEGAEEEQGEDR